MSSVPLALLLGRLLPGAQGCVSDLTSARVILSLGHPLNHPSSLSLRRELLRAEERARRKASDGRAVGEDRGTRSTT